VSGGSGSFGDVRYDSLGMEVDGDVFSRFPIDVVRTAIALEAVRSGITREDVGERRPQDDVGFRDRVVSLSGRGPRGEVHFDRVGRLIEGRNIQPVGADQ
jgi:hypothetical protein